MFNYSDEDYLGLIHLQKAIVNAAKQKITYYWDGGKIQTLVVADAAEFSDKADAVTGSFIEIDGFWYNPSRIGIVKANNINLWVEFLGGKIIDKDFADATGPQAVIDAIESSFVEIDGKWYNGSQLHVARTNKATLTIQYDWLGNNQITVTYADSSAFDSAIDKIKAVGEGTGGSGGGGGGGSKTATPTFSVKPGAVDEGTKFTLSCATDGATIHYTTDGTDATLSSPTYTPGTEITVPAGGITVKAVAVVLGLATSNQAVGVYTIKPEELDYYAGVYNNPDEDTDIIPDFTKPMLVGLANCVSGLATKKEFGGPGDEHVFDGVNVTNGGRIVYAYPASLGEITKFITNGIQGDITDSFTLQNQTINGVTYNIWVLTDSTTTDGAPYAFI